MQIKEILKDKYILCLCEGSAELDVMNMLLEEDLLIFNKEDLIDGKFHKRESVSAVQEKFLGFAYKKIWLFFGSLIQKKRDLN